MPRTCRACSSPNRTAIDEAIVSGEPLRNIAKRVSISPAALLRHKTHTSQALVKASEKRETSIGNSILGRLESLCQHTQSILDSALEADDGRLALQAIRESRETLGGIFALVIKNAESGGLCGFSDSEVEAEIKRRGLDRSIEMKLIHVGGAPVDEWEELPESATALLPGKPKGKLYILRPHGGE